MVLIAKLLVNGSVLKPQTSAVTSVGRQVLDVLAAVREEEPGSLADQIYSNTLRLFFPGEPQP